MPRTIIGGVGSELFWKNGATMIESVEQFGRGVSWSASEKKIARKAYDAAFERQCRAVTAEAKRMLENVSEPAEIWRVHDYLTERRRDVSRVYHFSYSDLDIVFSRLMSDGWLTEADLAGLRPEKIANIRRGAEVFR